MLRVAQVMDGLEPDQQQKIISEMIDVYGGPLTNAERCRRYRERHRSDTETTRALVSNDTESDVAGSSDSSLLSLVQEATTQETTSEGASPVPSWPDALLPIPEFLTKISAPPEFADPVYWAKVDAWLGPKHSGVAYLDELPKYLAHQAVYPKNMRHKNRKKGFRNWLARSEVWAKQRQQRRTG